ncbi:MAG: single-stranded DNA-binding protein [Clostridiales bacterium]|nr:single-stranded DNA-binding protein [Clostridiales bacterium]MBR5740873.1 single-stranded DNA-binding protein [Bacillota bacterium]MBR6484974.1 single-stranded DNA-binding protein [Clostridiales bacterium]
MNKVMLVGRLTKDPELKNTSSQVQFCNFTIAVDRRFKDANGQRQADFINCVAWRQTASFIGSYFRKGSRIGIVGSIQSRSFDDNSGQKRYVTEVVVDEAEFVESGNGGNGNGTAAKAAPVQSAPQPAEGSVAATAPTAPKTSIAPDMSDDDDMGGGLDLPFEF